MENLGDVVVSYAIQAALAAVIFFGGQWVARLLTRIARGTMERRGIDPMLVAFGANVLYFAIIAFVIVAALGQLGIQTASFVAILGAAGLAIALAFQDSLSNFAAGVLLVTFRPFKIGDFIEGGGTSGVVEKIEIFTTTVRTGDNKTIIIPNASLYKGNIVNYSTKDTRRIDLVFGVGYDDDLDKARAVIERVLAEDDRILEDPAPVVGVNALGSSSVDFIVRPWVKSEDYWDVYRALTENMKKQFDAEGINIPYPQTDVHLHNVA